VSENTQESALLVAACNFGWGSVGKLRLILDELAGVRVILSGERDWVHVTQRLLFPAHRPEPVSGRPLPHTGLVINDPAAADAMAAAGVAVVYVDSLPYLWATPSEIPMSVARYCAQRHPGAGLPAGSPLAGRGDVIWVNPIVPRPRHRIGGGGVVLNVGGLHSHLSDGADEAYLALVVVPLICALRRDGYRILAVCGNVPRTLLDGLGMGDQVSVGPRTAYAFEDTLRHADILITSPGSTTLFQAAASGLPTVLLPPQNLSQILNAEIFASVGARVIGWPSSVMERSRVERLRPSGEDAVLEYIYGAIRAAAESAAVRAEVAECLSVAVAAAPLSESTLRWDPRLGVDGAATVARIVRQQLSRQGRLPRERAELSDTWVS
jgi:hydroxymethylcytosylglucuronate/cytosylglucuronate synthase